MVKEDEKRIDNLERLVKDLVTRMEKLEKECAIAQKKLKEHENKMSDNIRGSR